tara:strand:+ start:3367 stop:4047 length:681 start_codon:yes stop_codon:yes gene_type:complete
MKKGKMTAVVAVRAGSQRVKNKNVRPFADTNLLELKLKVLLRVKNIDEIVVNSDSEIMLEIAKKYNVKSVKREEYFASSEASNSDFHKHIAEVTETDFIFLAPVCSPFIGVKKHYEAINNFMQSDFDSLTSCELVKGHLWLDGEPINYSLENVPNSQDLPDIKKLNYGISIINRQVMIDRKGLVGFNPDFIILNEIESFDIDEMETFNTAEVLYNNLNIDLYEDQA